MKDKNNMVELNNEVFEQLSTSITSSIISLKSEKLQNLKSIEAKKKELLEYRKQLAQIQSKIDKTTDEISKLRYNRRHIIRDIRTGKRKSYKLNRSYTSGIAQINLEDYTKEGKRK